MIGEGGLQWGSPWVLMALHVCMFWVSHQYQKGTLYSDFLVSLLELEAHESKEGVVRFCRCQQMSKMEADSSDILNTLHSVYRQDWQQNSINSVSSNIHSILKFPIASLFYTGLLKSQDPARCANCIFMSLKPVLFLNKISALYIHVIELLPMSNALQNASLSKFL